MKEERQQYIFKVRADIQKNKSLGFLVKPLTYLGKPAVRIICKQLSVNFLIDPVSLSDLKLRWYKSIYHYVSFYDWLLQSEV